MNTPASTKAPAAPTTKVLVASITIEQAEGVSDRLVKGTVATYAAANALLKRIRDTAPNDGTYYKTDFKVTFADGEDYTGRFDAQSPLYPTAEPADLARHMREHVEYLAGYRCPAHITQAQYDHQLAEREKLVPGSLKEAGEWLSKYALTDPVVVVTAPAPKAPVAAPAVTSDVLGDRLATVQTQLSVLLATVEASLPVYQKAGDTTAAAKARFQSLEIRKALAAIIRAKDI